MSNDIDDVTRARMKKTFDETVAQVGAAREKQLRDAVALNAELLTALTELVSGLNETTWSSWQTTYLFSPQLVAANELLSRLAEGRQ